MFFLYNSGDGPVYFAPTAYPMSTGTHLLQFEILVLPHPERDKYIAFINAAKEVFEDLAKYKPNLQQQAAKYFKLTTFIVQCTRFTIYSTAQTILQDYKASRTEPHTGKQQVR